MEHKWADVLDELVSRIGHDADSIHVPGNVGHSEDYRLGLRQAITIIYTLANELRPNWAGEQKQNVSGDGYETSESYAALAIIGLIEAFVVLVPLGILFYFFVLPWIEVYLYWMGWLTL